MAALKDRHDEALHQMQQKHDEALAKLPEAIPKVYGRVSLEATRRGDVTTFRNGATGILRLTGKASYTTCAMNSVVDACEAEKPGRPVLSADTCPWIVGRN